MGKVRIKNRELLVRILKTISWLDDRRWTKDDNYNFLKFFTKGLKNHEKILTHWLCYITDRQMAYEIVWEKGDKSFLSWHMNIQEIRTNLRKLY